MSAPLLKRAGPPPPGLQVEARGSPVTTPGAGAGGGSSAAEAETGGRESPARPPPATSDVQRLMAALPSVGETEAWRKAIGGLWKWSEAVPLLEKYYHQNGTGLLASHYEVQWKGGAFRRVASGFQYPKLVRLGCQLRHMEEIRANLERHVAGQRAEHILLVGEKGTGKTALLLAALEEFKQDRGLRVVFLPPRELKGLAALGEEMKRSPCLRFAVVIDDLHFKKEDERRVLMREALDSPLEPWATNAVVCVTTRGKGGYDILETDEPPPQSAIPPRADMGASFGLSSWLKRLYGVDYDDTCRQLGFEPEYPDRCGTVADILREQEVVAAFLQEREDVNPFLVD